MRCVCVCVCVCVCLCVSLHTLSSLCAQSVSLCICVCRRSCIQRGFNQVPHTHTHTHTHRPTSADWTGITQTSHVFLAPSQPVIMHLSSHPSSPNSYFTLICVFFTTAKSFIGPYSSSQPQQPRPALGCMRGPAGKVHAGVLDRALKRERDEGIDLSPGGEINIYFSARRWR